MVKNDVIYRTFVHLAQKCVKKSQKFFRENHDLHLILIEQMCYNAGE